MSGGELNRRFIGWVPVLRVCAAAPRTALRETEAFLRSVSSTGSFSRTAVDAWPRSKAPHGTLIGRRHSVAHLCGLGLNDTGAAPSDSLRPASVPNTVPSRSQRPLAAIYPTTRHTIDAGQGQFELPW